MKITKPLWFHFLKKFSVRFTFNLRSLYLNIKNKFLKIKTLALKLYETWWS